MLLLRSSAMTEKQLSRDKCDGQSSDELFWFVLSSPSQQSAISPCRLRSYANPAVHPATGERIGSFPDGASCWTPKS